MNVVVTIDGRYAIPVRALPYVWSALEPRTLIRELTHFTTVVFPERGVQLVGMELGMDRKPKEGWLKGIFAYHLDDGRPTKIEPNDWHRIGRPITERPEARNAVGRDYSDEIALLPAGVFVWRDELEPKIKGMEVHPYSPWIPEAIREKIMEGFERFIEKPAEVPEQDVLVALPAYLDPDHPCYSPKLAQAIECWLALFGDGGTAIHNRSYSDQIKSWLTAQKVTSDQRALTSVIQPAAKGTSQQAERVKGYRDNLEKDVRDIKSSR